MTTIGPYEPASEFEPSIGAYVSSKVYVAPTRIGSVVGAYGIGAALDIGAYEYLLPIDSVILSPLHNINYGFGPTHAACLNGVLQ